jgi:hypothetical protein
VASDEFYLLARPKQWKLPLPPQMNNHGNVIVSLGALCAWLAPQAEALGVEIFPGFAASEPLFDDKGAVCGVRIGDMGVAKDGSHKPSYTPGIDIHAPITVLAEGVRGHISKQLIKRFELDAELRSADLLGSESRNCGRCPPGRVPNPGLIMHTFGWPLGQRHLRRQLPLPPGPGPHRIGYVSGLDYQDPKLQPFEPSSSSSTIPLIRPLLEGGTILSAGARAIVGGRLPVAAEGRDAGRDPDRRHRRHCSTCRRSRAPTRPCAAACSPPNTSRTGGSAVGFDAAAGVAGDGRIEEGAQHQARLPTRVVVGHGECRLGDRHRRPHSPVDAEATSRPTRN